MQISASITLLGHAFNFHHLLLSCPCLQVKNGVRIPPSHSPNWQCQSHDKPCTCAALTVASEVLHTHLLLASVWPAYSIVSQPFGSRTTTKLVRTADIQPFPSMPLPCFHRLIFAQTLQCQFNALLLAFGDGCLNPHIEKTAACP
jgi:hypothetical protein